MLGVVTVWPMLYIALFVVGVNWASRHKDVIGQAPAADGLPVWFTAILGVHAASIAVGVGVTIFYLVYLFRASRVPRNKRLLWAALLTLGNILAIVPFYWLYVWPPAPRERQVVAIAKR